MSSYYSNNNTRPAYLSHALPAKPPKINHALTAMPYSAQPAYYQQPHPQYYYTQQPHPTMDYTQQYGNPSYGNYQYPQYNQQQPEAIPNLRNPFVPPPAARSQYSAQNASFDPVREQEIAQWQSAYQQQPEYEGKKGVKKGENPNLTAIGVRPAAGQDGAEPKVKLADGEKKKTVVRKGGGETWEDDTLLEWDSSKFRIYVGNLAGEVTDDSLAKAFALYDVNKARVVRDKRTTKSKGFGFVEFHDHELGFKAAREMVGKYIGSHPVTIQKAKTDVHATVQKDKKGKHGKGRDKGGKNKDDPLRANTGAHIAKKPVLNPNIKLLG